MTEKEFWSFLQQKGKADMMIGSVTTGDAAIDAVGAFINAHALLPKGFESVTEDEIESMGELLFQEGLKIKTKEAIIILLAHQVSDSALAILTKFNLKPDKELEGFARFALDESLIWNE